MYHGNNRPHKLVQKRPSFGYEKIQLFKFASAHFSSTETFEHGNLGEEYLDSSKIYSKRLLEIARKVAREKDIHLFEGNYGGTSGPTYETHTEVVAVIFCPHFLSY